jgi:hypothetical protein
MGWGEEMWAAFRDVLRLQDKVQSVAAQLGEQQRRIETMSLDVAQLKMAVAILLSQQGIKDLPKLPFEAPKS